MILNDFLNNIKIGYNNIKEVKIIYTEYLMSNNYNLKLNYNEK